MKKSIAFVLVLVLLSTSSTLTLLPTKADSEIATDPKIGVYYYPWYNGNWSIYHQNCPDTPILGQYDSSNLSVIIQHLNWFEQLGINFIIFSWWGKNSPSDNNTGLILSQIAKNYTNIQFFIMVEPFGSGWSQAYNASTGEYNFTLIYNYIYDTYITKFNSSCFNLDGKPVIGFYDDISRTLTRNGVPGDNRFALRHIGCQPNDDWEYQVPDSSLSTQPVCRDGEISVCPRYDANGWHEDVNYTQGLYDQQWIKAINETKQGKVDIITIISWNEFAERTQIEPTWDTTSAFKDNPFYLFNKTENYIEILKNSGAAFRETGLPNCTLWAVNCNGQQYQSNTPYISISLPPGTHTYYVPDISGYTISPQNGTVTPILDQIKLTDITFSPSTQEFPMHLAATVFLIR